MSAECSPGSVIWRELSCPEPDCGCMVVTDQPIGSEIVCPFCRSRIVVEAGDVVELEQEEERNESE